ncbi:MAG: 16S rRNA (adenine(1518)-N(6)/adenine(1519)-N(6))-dimethyltransferase RsmA [Gammaproteobacteria bacterium]|nr:16S rRNA (adenine(1518)-N(6)/adenine(1519)-N(6))-dimethyltransferase RsmA [Gammaproteobacteria bacterium]
MKPGWRRKRFGQHFLHDCSAIQRIVDAISLRPEESLVEIGPGTGALTGPLLERFGQLDAVELDRDLAARLERRFGASGALRVHYADALQFDFSALANHPLQVVGNLPYNISTPLLFHLLKHLDHIREMLFMLQKEVVDRMAAAPGGHTYGRLSVMLQYHCEIDKLFTLGPEAFVPPPEVESGVVRLRPYAAPPFPVKDQALFSRLVAQAFAQRRKTLRNSLKGLLEETEIRSLGIDPGARAETLALAQFVRLTNLLIF